MKTLLVARKSLIEILREPQLLLLVVMLPLIFLAITAVTYGGALLVTHHVLVVDAGAHDDLLEELRSQHYPDGRTVFDISPATEAQDIDAALGAGSASAALFLSEDEAGRLVVTLRGDALSLRFYRASTLLSRAITGFAEREAGQSTVVQIAVDALGTGAPQTELDIYAPGMMVFGLLLIVPQTAMLLAREIRWGTLRRLRLTQMNAWHLLAGVSLSQMVVAVGQVVLVFIAALLLGFHNQGSLPLAIGVGLAICFSAIGQGLVVACFVENDSQAANVGSTVTMLQVFLTGAFYQLPAITIFHLGGHQIDLFDVFPARHGLLALQQVLTYGATFGEIAFRLGATLLLSALYMLAGILIFQRLKLRQAL